MPLHRLPQHRPGRAARRRPGTHDDEGEVPHDRHPGPPRRRDRPRPPPQGGPAADHRPHPLDRQPQLPGMLHLAMVRSPFAHARITAIDMSAAQASTNVVAVLTGADLAETQGVCINAWDAWPITPDQVTPDHLPMPADRVSLRRRDRRGRGGPQRRRGPRRRRAGRRRLRGAAGRAGPQGGGGATPRTAVPRAPRPRHQQVRASGASTPRRPAPAATSTRRSSRPAPTAS